MMAGKLKAEATNILRLICDIFAAILQSLISICRVLSCNADKKLQHNSRTKLILTIFPCLNRSYLGADVVGADSDQAGVDETAIGGGHGVRGGVGVGEGAGNDNLPACIYINQ